MSPVLWLIYQVLNIYFWIVIIAVVASWLVGFGVINAYNPVARQILNVLRALTEPVFRVVRKVIPIIGGLDLSPLIVCLLIAFLQYALIYYAPRFGL